MMGFLLLLLVFCCCCCYLDSRVEGALSFKFETTTLCPNNKKLPATIVNVKSFNLKGKLCTIAEVDVKETLTRPMLLEIGLKRCNEDLSQCTTYPSIKLDNICNQLNTTYFGPDFLQRAQPLLKCPIKPGRYLFNRTIADFSNLSKTNIITGKYKSKMVVLSTRNGNRRPLMCWNIITTVSAFTSRKN